MEKVFARDWFSSPLPVAVARTSQSPVPLCDTLKPTAHLAHFGFPTAQANAIKTKKS
ncbi:hypothetical protein [Epilithonimonas hominis]|uniref:hypothetical protein n=1 Tax=Epilithonimonas hominis TaxID=420404 RepID=UPI0016116AAB|nr:hypothetical protein [Epilithonimonas hominis]